MIREDNVGRLCTKLVASGANIAVTYGAERRLHEKGIVSIPDFIANAGGVICAAMEYRGATEAQAFQTIAEKIRANTEDVLLSAERDRRPPRDAAVNATTRTVGSSR